MLTALDYVAAGAAAVAAGGINALAGGGTLVTFPTLVAIGVPAVPANVTNTVSLLPGYLAGSWAQRQDLESELAQSKVAVAVAGAGGLAGSILLLAIPAHAFRLAVPYLILLSCALLLAQDRLRDRINREPESADATRWSAPLLILIFAAAAYGGFFGAGMGIMLLAVLGLFSDEPLTKVNALKSALSFVINLVAAVFFAFSGHVSWQLVPVMAFASLVGGFGGGRLVRVIDAVMLRRLVVVAGVAVAISFWVA